MPTIPRAITNLSPEATNRLKEIGEDLRAAIKARGDIGEFAERVGMHRNTLAKALKGDPCVDIGIYVSILEGLGLLDHLQGLGAPERDTEGQSIRLGRRKRARDISISSDF
jgi:hypothetical protein